MGQVCMVVRRVSPIETIAKVFCAFYSDFSDAKPYPGLKKTA